MSLGRHVGIRACFTDIGYSRPCTKWLLTEGTLSNLFFVQDNVIHTPAITCGLLDGITPGEPFDCRGSLFDQLSDGGPLLLLLKPGRVV